jgi:hypothetical protein
MEDFLSLLGSARATSHLAMGFVRGRGLGRVKAAARALHKAQRRSYFGERSPPR